MNRCVKNVDNSHRDLYMVDATTASMGTGIAPNSRTSGLRKHLLNSQTGGQSGSTLGTIETKASPPKLNEQLAFPIKA